MRRFQKSGFIFGREDILHNIALGPLPFVVLFLTLAQLRGIIENEPHLAELHSSMYSVSKLGRDKFTFQIFNMHFPTLDTTKNTMDHHGRQEKICARAAPHLLVLHGQYGHTWRVTGLTPIYAARNGLTPISHTISSAWCHSVNINIKSQACHLSFLEYFISYFLNFEKKDPRQGQNRILPRPGYFFVTAFTFFRICTNAIMPLFFYFFRNKLPQR